MSKQTSIVVLIGIWLAGSAYALPPPAPVLEVTEKPVGILAKWNENDTDGGYYFAYARYPDFAEPVVQDMGTDNTLFLEMAEWDAYWVGVFAYNADGMSPISNIEPLILNPASVPALAAPRLNLNLAGRTARLSWDAVPGASGYRVMQSTTPFALADGEGVDVGPATEYRLEPGDGSELYLAVIAYDSTGSRGAISNIHRLHPDKRIVALLPPLSGPAGTLLSRGLEAGFDPAHFEGVRLEIVGGDWNSDPDLMSFIVHGDKTINSRGYMDDPDVLALITAATAGTIIATRAQTADEPLIVSPAATSNILDGYDNVMKIAPSNIKQSELMYNSLSQSAREEQNLYRYAVVLEESPVMAVHSYDLYLSLFKRAFDRESEIQLNSGLEKTTLPTREEIADLFAQLDGSEDAWQQVADIMLQILNHNTPGIARFAQLAGSFTFDGTPATAQRIATVLDILEPDRVVYLGSAARFETLHAAVSSPHKWLCGAGNYDFEAFKDTDITVLNLATPQDPAEAAAVYAEDTIRVLGRLISQIPPESLDRAGLLAEARKLDDAPYQGITGVKRFHETAETGTYEFIRPGATGWERMP